MADAKTRAVVARQHTAQLLKMLRGYSPPAEPHAVPEAPPAAIAEAAALYVRREDASPLPPLPGDQRPPLPLPARGGPGSTPTVGEMLRRSRHAHNVLGQLMTQADQLLEHSRILRAYLPAPLCDHVVLIRLDAESWEVQTESAGWATRLRYALSSIRQALGQHFGLALPKPHIRVVPLEMPLQPRRPPLSLTRRNAEVLEAAAHTLADPRLSAALRRLAARGRLEPPIPSTPNPP